MSFNSVCNKESISEYSVQRDKKIFKKDREKSPLATGIGIRAPIPPRGHFHCPRLNKVLNSEFLLNVKIPSTFWVMNENVYTFDAFDLHPFLNPKNALFERYFLGIKKTVMDPAWFLKGVQHAILVSSHQLFMSCFTYWCFLHLILASSRQLFASFLAYWCFSQPSLLTSFNLTLIWGYFD